MTELPREGAVIHPAFSKPEQHFCDHFITPDELGSDDPWAGTYCKRASGHDGPHSALYLDERGSSAAFEVRYHVPRSQVWEGSRGRQIGAIHLHAAADVTLTAKRGRCGSLARTQGQALCGKRGWYERGVEHESDLRIRCGECTKRATRYGVDWPEVAHAA